ncbi:MAG: hypothetical protein JHC33_04215 [Ignisphaera sp.]|nr:hypothetical protein [Ignisphaera sp.]
MLTQKKLSNLPDKVKERIEIFGKPCIWSILAYLSHLDEKTINITALIRELNSNYGYISKCIELMKSLGMIEEIKFGRVRLIKLNMENDYVKNMLMLLNM